MNPQPGNLRRLPELRSRPLSPYLLLLLTISWAFIVGACAGDSSLKARLVADVSSGRAPLAVTFTNNSEGADVFEWDFGDGSASTTSDVEQPVTHEYTKAGTHTVTLKASKKGGPADAGTATARITVEPGDLHQVSLAPTEAVPVVAEEQQFTTAAADAYGNPISDVTLFFQVDEAAGRIDDQGRFTAGTRAGSYDAAVSVEATRGSETRKATASVTLKPGPLGSVKVEPPTATLQVTKEQRVDAIGADQYGNPVPGLQYAFRADARAGQIDDTGKFVAGTKAGTFNEGVVVEAIQGPVRWSAKVQVTIEPGPLDQITIEPPQATVAVTAAQRFAGISVDRYGNPIPGLSVTFYSGGDAGSVDDEGNFTAGARAGTFQDGVTVEVTEGAVKKTAGATVILEAGPLDHVTLEPAAVALEVTSQQRFSATPRDRFDNPIPALVHTYRADEEAGEVDAGGNFTAGTLAGAYEGAVKVDFTQGEMTAQATASVTVTHGPLDRVAIGERAVRLDIGQSHEFTARALDAFDNPIPDAAITWEGAEGVTTVASDGRLTAGTLAGTFQQGIKATARVSADVAESVASISINPDPLHAIATTPFEVAAGGTRQLEVIATDQYGNRVEEIELAWTMLNVNGGSVTPGGTLAAGEVALDFRDAVQVRATQGEVTLSDTSSVTIVPGQLDQVVLGPRPLELGMEMTQQFVAAGADRFGNRIPRLAIEWSVETGGGVIDSGGLFTAGSEPGLFHGTVKATANQGEISRAGATGVTVLPDRIAFISERDDGLVDVYIMDVDGGHVERLTRSEVVELWLSWSPDGRRLGVNPLNGIFLMNDTGAWTSEIVGAVADLDLNVVLFPVEMAVSRDGGKVAFVILEVPIVDEGLNFDDTARDIFAVDVDGGNKVQLTDTAGGDEFVPGWSPDGTRIVYDFTPTDGQGDIWVMNADGSGKRRLTTDPANDTSPSFSLDGTRILFTSNRDGDNDLYLMDADGSNVRSLTSNSIFDGSASWSPDGTEIVFTSARDDIGANEIYIMDADGANVRRITTNSFTDSDARWAPRKRGVKVSQAALVIPNSSTLALMSVQQVTARARAAVVRIETDLGSGSGFIIDGDGFILTNNHVIIDAGEVSVILDDGSSFTGTVHGRDLVRDLALVRIDTGGLPTLQLGDLSQVSLGQQAVVLGYPLGAETINITSGLVSALELDEGRNINWIQTDSAVNPGNSGGPILDLQGRVIGVVSSKFVSVAIEGVAFAISANTVTVYLDRLRAGEVITEAHPLIVQPD